VTGNSRPAYLKVSGIFNANYVVLFSTILVFIQRGSVPVKQDVASLAPHYVSGDSPRIPTISGVPATGKVARPDTASRVFPTMGTEARYRFPERSTLHLSVDSSSRI